MSKSLLPYVGGAAACLLFLALGIVLLPYPGAHYDEVLFTSCLYAREFVEFVAETPIGAVPVMLQSYLGSLKALLYIPILRGFDNGHYLLRLPVLCAAALAVWFFFLFLRRLAGARVATLVALLLATDAAYLLSSVFDWGPVALQHVFLCVSLYAGLRYAQSRRAGWLFLGGLATGLALWDKALVVWLAAGFAVALLIVWPRELWAIVRSPRTLAAALAGLLLGAAPLIYFNIEKPWRTLESDVYISGGATPAQKLIVLERTFSGYALFGYIVRHESPAPPPDLKRWEKIPLWLSARLRAPQRSFQALLLFGALLAAPLLYASPWRRPALFFLIAAVAAWLFLFLTPKAGAGLHHTILLWPLPQILLAFAAAEAARRWPRRGPPAVAAILLLAAAANGAVVNQYLAQFIAAGPTDGWTDAIRPAVGDLGRRPGRTVFAVDWGVIQQANYYSAGRIRTSFRSDFFVNALPDSDARNDLLAALAQPGSIFICRTEGHEIFKGVRRKFLDFAATEGYEARLLNVIPDRHRVPMFEIYEFGK